MENLYRPFELLKLIRDRELTSVADFHRSPSYPLYFVRDLVDNWQKVGIVEVDMNGNVTPTPLLFDILKSFDIRLTQLSPYNREALVCTPAFGAAQRAPIEVDVFVLMPFSPELKPVYDDHICSAAKELELVPARADDFFTSRSIVGDIWNAINSCQIVVADCTGRNANVFYELGVAHTLGKPVILIAQSTEDIPFDVQHLRAIIYKYTPRGMKKFEERLLETLKIEISRPSSLSDYIAYVRGDGSKRG